MKSLTCVAAATSALFSLISAQNAIVTDSLTVAAATVAAMVPAAPVLFKGETLQLTDGVLADVIATIQMRRSRVYSPFPAITLYPREVFIPAS